MKIPFYKLQGAGNDFVAIDNRNNNFTKEQLIGWCSKLCDRKYGIGADGLLVIHPSDVADYEMIYRNADGSDAGMCGNGGRCIARFAYFLGEEANHTFNVHDKIYKADVTDHNVTISWMSLETKVEHSEADGYDLLDIYTATEHKIFFANEALLQNDSEMRLIGAQLRYHKNYAPKGTNINFTYGNEDDKIAVCTYERGVEDLTLACGTGSLAAAIGWHYNCNLTTEKNKITVECPGGTLVAHFEVDLENKIYKNLKLEGPAEIVFNGEIEID